MTRFVSRLSPTVGKSYGPDEKYVKQTYEVLSNNNTNLENIAVQIAQLPVREQKHFFRLLLNYIDVVRVNDHNPAMRDVVELCYKMMETVNDHYEELEKLQQMELEF